jgi:hypothetical protein
MHHWSTNEADPYTSVLDRSLCLQLNWLSILTYIRVLDEESVELVENPVDSERKRL